MCTDTKQAPRGSPVNLDKRILVTDNGMSHTSQPRVDRRFNSSLFGNEFEDRPLRRRGD